MNHKRGFALAYDDEEDEGKVESSPKKPKLQQDLNTLLVPSIPKLPTTETVASSSNQTKTSNSSKKSEMPFATLCDFFERMSATKKSDAKKSLFQKLFDSYDSDDYFPLMRLLLPSFDKERQTYGVKEANLGKLYVEILGIAQNSVDADRLINWRKPKTSEQAKIAGDFANAVEISLTNRCPSKGDLNITQLNEILDQLNIATDK